MNSSYFYCRNSVVSKINRFAAILLCPVIGICFLLGTAYMLFDAITRPGVTAAAAITTLFFSGLYLAFGIALLVFGKRWYQMESRKIMIDQQGFTIKGFRENRYTWAHVSDIGIIAFAATANRNSYQKEICIFLKPAGQDQLKKLFSDYLYGVFHCDSFILIDYEPLLAESLAEYSGRALVDYQDVQLIL